MFFDYFKFSLTVFLNAHLRCFCVRAAGFRALKRADIGRVVKIVLE